MSQQPLQYFWHNDSLKPISHATVSLFDINYCYGYGVYETLKVRGGILYFLDKHCARLEHSAQQLDISHSYTQHDIAQAVTTLVKANNSANANLKILLVGDSSGRTSATAQLYILPLNPLFPQRSLYKHGATATICHGQRHFPQAKSLDMLMSAMAYRTARSRGCYDALLINRKGEATEGTRTNLFVTDGNAVYTPPDEETLLGVTKITVLESLAQHGILVHQQPLPWNTFDEWKGVFLTSTSSKIMPIVAIDELRFEIPQLIRDAMRHYNIYLDEYAASQVAIVQTD